VSIACARTVVAGDKELFLGELSISYLSAATLYVSFSFGVFYACLVCNIEKASRLMAWFVNISRIAFFKIVSV
jgi:hypothetical protein